jgi:Tol biopolymer transport system component
VFAAHAAGGPPQLISQAPDGEPADGASTPLAISATGRFVVFASTANGLGPAVPTGVVQIYLFDRETGSTELVSRATSGTPGNASSGGAAISANGRFVAFASAASNLVDGDTNGAVDVFVRDRTDHTTRRVDVGPRGVQANGAVDPQVVSISADGSIIAFSSAARNLVSSDTNGQWNVFVHNQRSGTTSRVSAPQPGIGGSGPSLFPSVSADGNVVAFESIAPLTHNDAAGTWDIFVRNRATGGLARVPVPSAGPPQLSADGNTVAFLTTAAPLVPAGAVGVATWSRSSGDTNLATVDGAGDPSTGRATGFSVDGNGGKVAFATAGSDLLPGDLNGLQDVYVHIG